MKILNIITSIIYVCISRMASSFSLFALLIISHLLISGVVSDTTFTLLNNCNDTIWPGIKSSTLPPIKNTGFALEKGESKSIVAATEWVGQFWGRTHCAEDSTGNFTCLTGDCGSGRAACFDSKASAPLATITEFATNISDGMDFFDVSVVNGYNLPIMIVPKDKSGARSDCLSTSCIMDMNSACPPELKVMSSDGGEQVACKSACRAFGDAKHCCTGAYSAQDKCKPTSYSKVFKTSCPTAHSILYDDDNTTFVCTEADFLISFCPTPNYTRKSGGECGNETNSGSDPKCLYKQGNNTKAPGPENNTKASGLGNTTKASGQVNTTKASGPINNTKALRTGNTMALGLKIGIAGVAASMLILFLLCFICYRRIKTRHNSSSYPKDVEAFIRKYGTSIPKRFKYSTLKKITNSFKEELGKGGYGNVYKGSLSDGCVVAVKVLNATKGNGEEFINEVASIGKTSHVNVVSLLGFVYEGKKRALIYEFMPNGSLEKFIHGTTPSLIGQCLSWEKLYSIALGIARGLEYLHCGCTTQILHFDIKPHNILLDEDFCPKISDFGLAKLYTRKENVLSSIMQARGTIGYIAPEVISRNFGQVSHKSDVYSYGMMILEMVGGRKNVDTRVARTSEIYFPRWVYKHIHDNEETSSADNITEEENHIVRKMMIVGLWCIQTNPSQRPSISKVIEMFEGNLAALEIPPKPYMCSPPTSPPNSQQKTLPRSSSLRKSNSSSELVPR